MLSQGSAGSRRRARLAGALAIVPVLVAVGASAAGGGVQRSPVSHVRTPTGVLRSDGTVIGRFNCRIRISEYPSRFTVTAQPESGWMTTPRRGHWLLFYEVRGRNAGRTPIVLQPTYRSPAHSGRLAFTSTDHTASSSPQPVGRRYACGLLLGRMDAGAVRVYRKLYLTVSWPKFAFLGVNAPVDPNAPHGSPR